MPAQTKKTARITREEAVNLDDAYTANAKPAASKLYMAYNHNGTELMRSPGTQAAADKEAKEYRAATGNTAYVDLARF